MPSGHSHQSGVDQHSNPVMSTYESWAMTKPLITLCFCIWMGICAILSLCFSGFRQAIDCNLQYAVYHLEIYRVSTAGLFSWGILSSVFAIASFGHIGAQIESIKDLFVNVSWLVITYLISALGLYPGVERMSSFGVWNVIFPLFVIDSMMSPESPTRFLFLPWEIKSKYIPIVTFGILVLLGGFRADFFLSLGIGYAYAAGKLSYIEPTESCLKVFETTGFLSCLSNREKYITCSNTTEDGSYMDVPQVEPTSQRAQRHTSGQESNIHTFGDSTVKGDIEGGKGGNSNNAVSSSFTGTGFSLSSSSSSNPSRSPTDPSIVRDARLVAIDRSNNPKNNSKTFHHKKPSLYDNKIGILQDMGFDVELATRALESCRGDISGAVAYLSS